jgi:DNA invertase Pin-like site-specific DNA recombinase
MMECAERGEFQNFYLYSLSRLARESLITLSLLKRLVFEFHVRVISISDGIDTNVTNWELIAAIMSVVGEQYLRDLSAAVLRGQEGIVLAKLCVGDYCFGYSSMPIPGSENTRRGRNPRPHKAYVVCETTAAWVERIFSWFVKDKWSLAESARELTRSHVPNDHRSTTPVWTAKNVRSVLENEKYVGIWPWGLMKNERDPETGRITQRMRTAEDTEKWTRLFPELRIVKDDLFGAAQEMLQENVERYTNHRSENGRLNGSKPDLGGMKLLSNLIECKICHSKFVYKGTYLHCPSHNNG